jgi:hypothetical protein
LHYPAQFEARAAYLSCRVRTGDIMMRQGERLFATVTANERRSRRENVT